ncbi:hypothetical protein EJP82_06800 [Paenibacillus anaericanus]|uniref:Lipoprotein n=1 Tax=Paenibacillus anaericanus TaxID=170367 RepID=A0A3S1BQW2_9BACL|nr:hypothetical protein [Paenibacillus anaericanus]RUT47412.1 hypothetical protein EJP82_06800 [Paenibacillus anaericanus]
MKLKYILLPCVMVIALTGCFNGSIENKPSQKEVVEEYTEGNELTSMAKITLEDFKIALQAEGLELITVEDGYDWLLNNNKPNNFTVGNPIENIDPTKLEQVSIYVFESEHARKKGLEDFNKQREKYDMMIPRIYEAENVMLFYWAHADMDKPAKYEPQFQKAIKKLKLE